MEIFDYCIIGAGPLGLISANKLSEAGKNVVVLERGDKQISEENYSSKINTNSKNLEIHDNILILGGASNFWQGRTGKMMEIDFKKRDWVDNSGWPFQIDELEPFYQEAHDLLRLKNSYKSSQRISEEYLSKKIDKEIFNALNSNNFLIRGMQYMSKENKNFKYLINNKFKLLLNHEAHSFNLKFKKKIDSVNVIIGKKEVKIYSNMFVIASGGIENCKIIKQSKDLKKNFYLGKCFQDHPNGLVANIRLNKSFVNKFKFLERKNSIKDFIEFALNPSEKFQKENKVLNISFEVRSSKMSFKDQYFMNYIRLKFNKSYQKDKFKNNKNFFNKIKLRTKFLFSIGIYDLIKILKILFNTFGFKFFNQESNLNLYAKVEEVPQLNNEIKLDGYGKLKINYKYHRQAFETVKKTTSFLIDIFEKYNIGQGEISKNIENFESFEKSFSVGNHPIGSTRMSENDESGVVDSNLKYHFADNLYVLGSSTFPTGSNSNPTFTAIALTLRFIKHVLNK